ncbi:NUDIX domain-containing protein [Macrococcus equipercicus]|uniref:NUDIX domain-containing protein n=1 Tax=Macrococcus equipercicus TaxID=69967 RepID=A0A9Q9BVQ6_9STAP|nr:NUDIX domain-containing protein [Macrococcus equipercicus]KAA1039090.1 NUDIX domain-containing protein [Macrococcus equipercicus]UTH13267.1 NUDIX domain-containing protein [Macrococcus equipercicus]
MEFIDQLGCRVVLQRDKPVHDHVLVIATYQGRFVLTHQKERGIEFPGGKREAHESTIEAAGRELFEETGGRTSSLKYITTYTVHADTPFTKDVFTAVISSFEPRDHYYETYGPVIVDRLDEVERALRSRLLDDDCINYIVSEVI